MDVATFEPQSDFFRRRLAEATARGEAEGRARGRASGEAVAVLAVLAARGITVPAEARARVSGCTDLAQLETWARRAATAQSLSDVFDER